MVGFDRVRPTVAATPPPNAASSQSSKDKSSSDKSDKKNNQKNQKNQKVKTVTKVCSSPFNKRDLRSFGLTLGLSRLSSRVSRFDGEISL
jgi:hypothetical protein